MQNLSEAAYLGAKCLVRFSSFAVTNVILFKFGTCQKDKITALQNSTGFEQKNQKNKNKTQIARLQSYIPLKY